MKEFLIIILYSGENEYKTCLESIKCQSEQDFDVHVIEGLSNVAAHNALYSKIMEEEKNYKFFMKCDADMVLKRETILTEILEAFKKNQNINHICFSVSDWFSDKNIMGLHVFKSGVQWKLPINGVFLDPDPINSRKLSLLDISPAPIAFHANNPSGFQAFYFGMHRTIKALRVTEQNFNLKTSIGHFQLLYHLFNKFRDRHDRRLGFSLLGMKHVLESGLNNLELTKTDYLVIFEKYKNMPNKELIEKVKRFFPENFFGWIILYTNLIGLKKISMTIYQILLRKLGRGKV